MLRPPPPSAIFRFRDNAEEGSQRMDEGAHQDRERIFIAWDFQTRKVRLTLQLLHREGLEGLAVDVPGFDSVQGEVWRQVVEPGIVRAHRVLALVDVPNANVAFEVGYALGLGRAVSLAHCSAAVPRWLDEPPFKSFLVGRADDYTRLAGCLRGGGSFGLPQAAAPGGRTLFPVSYTHLTLPTIYSV